MATFVSDLFNHNVHFIYYTKEPDTKDETHGTPSTFIGKSFNGEFQAVHKDTSIFFHHDAGSVPQRTGELHH